MLLYLLFKFSCATTAGFCVLFESLPLSFADEDARYANRRVCRNQSNEFAIRRQYLYKTVVIFVAEKTDGPNLFFAHRAFVCVLFESLPLSFTSKK